VPQKDGPRRWPPGLGLALGLALGVALGAAVGNLIDRTALGMVLGLALGLVAGLLIDDPRSTTDGSDGGADPDPPAGGDDDEPPGGGPQDGAIARAMLWLLAGLVALLLLAIAIAPELLEAPGQITGTLGLVLVAGVPGALVLLGLVARRRRIDRHAREE